MDEETLKKISVSYEELRGLLFGLGDAQVNQNIYDGPVLQYQEIVKHLTDITQQDLSRFLPRITQYNPGEWVADAKDLKTSASSLVAWLTANYLESKSPHYLIDSSPSTSVNVSQDVNVTQVVSIDIFELLTQKEQQFEEGTKERSFIEKVKSGLRGAKNTAAILALIAQTAADFNLTITDLQKIFS